MSAPEVPTVVYVHGAGNKPPADALKHAWDQDLFGQDMGQRTTMAHYADLLHPAPGASGADACTQEAALGGWCLLENPTLSDNPHTVWAAHFTEGVRPFGR